MTIDLTDTFVQGYLDAFGRLLPAVRRSAAQAVMNAMAAPDSYIRIVFTDIEQIHETVAVVEHLLRKENLYDDAKTRANFKKHKMVMELTNGSGIEFSSDHEKLYENFKKSRLSEEI